MLLESVAKVLDEDEFGLLLSFAFLRLFLLWLLEVIRFGYCTTLLFFMVEIAWFPFG